MCGCGCVFETCEHRSPIFNIKLLVLLLGDISIIIVTSMSLFDIINLIILIYWGIR